MVQLSAKLPGYLVPKLVRETAGETAKQMIAYWTLILIARLSQVLLCVDQAGDGS